MRAVGGGLVLLVVWVASSGCGDEVAMTGDVGAADVGGDGTGGDTVDPDGGGDGTGGGTGPLACGFESCPPAQPVDLPDRHPFDPERARHGAEVLATGELGGGIVPMLGLENLWIVWGGGPPEDYWAAFRARYGFYAAPGRELPLGIREVGGGMATFECLMCHANEVAGLAIMGVGNSQLDLQGLYDDMVALNERAPEFGFPSFPIPFEWHDVTGAAGATDAQGMGMTFASLYAPASADIETYYGYQQAPAWWSIRHRDRVYWDGSGQTGGYRTMMATLLGFGLTLSELQAQDEDFVDIHHFILSLQPPAWPYDPPDAGQAERGQDLFNAHCARCHGFHSGDSASYPDTIVPVADIGTDPVRAVNFGENEVEWINASWFGEDHPMQSTGGYLAPPLVGVWAMAPYLHNGSVPDLATLLDPPSRPVRWRRTGSGRDDYDPETLGWRYTVPDTPGTIDTIESRRTYETTRPGLSNAGHTYGGDLSAEERAELLAYLKTI